MLLKTTHLQAQFVVLLSVPVHLIERRMFTNFKPLFSSNKGKRHERV